jgi:uncharacterized protein with HEPN domain
MSIGLYHHALYGIVMDTGRSIATLTREMQGEDELFASTLTLRAVEAQLLIMAHTLGNLPPALHAALLLVDWTGWAVLHDKLRNGVQPRRDETWYAVNGLVPQTMLLLAELRRRQPGWFDTTL